MSNKLTNNSSNQDFQEAPKSGVDFYLSFWKTDRKNADGETEAATLFSTADKSTTVLASPGIGVCRWLGYIVRIEGQTETEPAYNIYSTFFERYDNAIQIRKRRAKDADARPEMVYEGKANDDAAKKEVKYLLGKSGYTVYLLLLSAKNKLIFAKIDGMNTGSFFEFNKENADAEFLEITGFEQVPNPKRKGEFINVLNFTAPDKGPDMTDDGRAKVDGLSRWLDHTLFYARNGRHKSADAEPTEVNAPASTSSAAPVTGIDFEKRMNQPVPAPFQTADDDMPF